jgi:hypothetical protein
LNMDDTNLNLNNLPKRIEGGQIVKPLESGIKLFEGRPLQLQIKPIILQNPEIQLYHPITNYSVCPFCKFSGPLEISYINSKWQKTCCIILVLTGLFFIAFLPFLIKDLSNQVLRCSSCKKELQKQLDENK